MQIFWIIFIVSISIYIISASFAIFDFTYIVIKILRGGEKILSKKAIWEEKKKVKYGMIICLVIILISISSFLKVSGYISEILLVLTIFFVVLLILHIFFYAYLHRLEIRNVTDYEEKG